MSKLKYSMDENAKYKEILDELNDFLYANRYEYRDVDLIYWHSWDACECIKQNSNLTNAQKEYLELKLCKIDRFIYDIQFANIPVWKLNNNVKRNWVYSGNFRDIRYMNNKKEKFDSLYKIFKDVLHINTKFLLIFKKKYLEDVLCYLFDFKVNFKYFSKEERRYIFSVYNSLLKSNNEYDIIKVIKLLFDRRNAFWLLEDL